MKNLILFLVVSFLSSTQAPAADSAEMDKLCPEKLQAFEDIQIQQSLSGDRKTCYLSIHPRDSFETLIYRDYLLTSDGDLMVFNSFNASESAGSDGAREFFFYMKEFSGFEWSVEEGGHLVVKGFSDRIVQFNLKNAQIESMTGAQVQVADEVKAENKGGVEILANSFPFIDAGFKMGDAPSSDKSKSSVLKNSTGETCGVKNSKIFKYVDGDAQIKPWEEIAQIASSACRGFKFE